MIAMIGVSDCAVEACSRSRGDEEDAETGADGDGPVEEPAVGASVSTVPVALTLPVTPCQVTVLASVFVDAPGVVICPSFEASTMTELCAIRVTDSMEAEASGDAKPSRRRVDVDSKWNTPPSSTETISAPPSARSHVKRHPSTPSTVTRREEVALVAVPID